MPPGLLQAAHIVALQKSTNLGENYLCHADNNVSIFPFSKHNKENIILSNKVEMQCLYVMETT